MNNEELNRESLIIHIKGLQQTLTERNERIAQLEKQVSQLKLNPVTEAATRKAYKAGWKACAGQMMEVTRTTARALSEVRKEAWELYLKGDKLDV